MKNDVIYRQEAIDAVKSLPDCANGFSDTYDKASILAVLDDVPSAQRTGRWKVSDLPKGKMKYCSECGFGQYIADERQYRFCPNCGARMEDSE